MRGSLLGIPIKRILVLGGIILGPSYSGKVSYVGVYGLCGIWVAVTLMANQLEERMDVINAWSLPGAADG